MNTLLLVEDDPTLQASLRDYFKKEGFSVIVCGSCKEARLAMPKKPDLVLLDWMLPDGQGIDLLRDLRNKGLKVPVIFLTAKADVIDKVLGLESGANDYVTKPFEPRELLARVRLRLRSTSSQAVESDALHSGGIEVNDREKRVFYRRQEVNLTKMEYLLLKLFLENPGRVFSREELLNKVWGYDSYPTTRTVDNHVLQLRQKLKESYFETVRGIGYRFRRSEE